MDTPPTFTYKLISPLNAVLVIDALDPVSVTLNCCVVPILKPLLLAITILPEVILSISLRKNLLGKILFSKFEFCAVPQNVSFVRIL